jgi:hypothetical protein
VKRFYLRYKHETINVVDADNLEEAISYFSKIKKLSIHSLLKIYIVTEQH